MISRIYSLGVILILSTVLLSGLKAQDTKVEVIKPILLDKSTLSGVGLKKVKLKDEPKKDFFQKRLFWGEELGIFVVSTESWVNRMDNFPFDEYIYMYHGEVEIRPDKGGIQKFYSGDHFWAPKGFTGEWEINVGDHLHYELSVITTKRADSLAIVDGQEHTLISPSDLSGAHIKLDSTGGFDKILKEGVELTISIHAESPQTNKSLEIGKEQVIHILSGQITIEDLSGEMQTFYAGDFIVLRAGLQGKWSTKGHGLIKLLKIQRSW